MTLRGLFGGGVYPKQPEAYPGEIGMQDMKAISNPTVRQLLGFQRVELKRRLQEVEDAIEALESHPEVMGVLEKLSKLGF